MTPHISRTDQSARSAADTRAEAIALALMGAGEIVPADLAETASWDRSGHPCAIGRDAIRTAQSRRAAPTSIWVDQIVTHGKAGTVSGRFTRDGEGSYMFCHIIRYTRAEAGQIAQIVTIEQRDPAHGR